MDYVNIHRLLRNTFDLTKDSSDVSDMDLTIRLIAFHSSPKPSGFDRLILPELRKHFGYEHLDSHIEENKAFKCPLFIPKHQKLNKKVIVLLHGLNERSWDKYLPWAAHLAHQTQIPVLAFPISFHMNRAPSDWVNRFSMKHLLEKRQAFFKHELAAGSFLNAALSERLTDHPQRFLTSGLQTIVDLLDMLQAMHQGEYGCIEKGTTFDFFSYSIGGFISQVLMLSNPLQMLDDAKHFLFCSGCLLEDMNGMSKSILDNKASECLQHYYLDVLPCEMHSPGIVHDFFEQSAIGKAFQSLLSHGIKKKEREYLFSEKAQQIKVLSLHNDTVMPYNKVGKAFGPKNLPHINTLDFDYPYTHEVPFPVMNKKITTSVNHAFEEVFSDAAHFLQ